MDSGVHASLHPHCQPQIIFAKFDLKVFYPPPCERTVWHFSQANFDHIKRAVDLFDWESALTDLDVNEQVSIFNNTITNIMSNFVPNEIIICDDRDPPWMNRHIKNLILYKANFYKTFARGKNSMFHLLTFHDLQNHLYWSLLKALLNDKKYHAFHLYFIITSILLILKKKVKSPTIFWLSSVPSYLTKVFYRHN